MKVQSLYSKYSCGFCLCGSRVNAYNTVNNHDRQELNIVQETTTKLRVIKHVMKPLDEKINWLKLILKKKRFQN